jgi:phospholipid-binding lipoprotein MlaA
MTPISCAQGVGRVLRATLVLSMLALLTACASGPSAHPKDPLEPLNRSVYRFNEGVDEAILKPVATTYRDVVPSPVRTGVSNFFGNLRDLWSAVNAVLQARPKEAAENFMRFNVNTFLGFGGLLDIATEMGIERTPLDIGQTLGRWGVPSGPYLVLPLIGPSSVRDGLGLVVDRQADPLQGVDHVATRNSLYTLRLTDTRTGLLPATELLDRVALDRYTFTRDSYLQRRNPVTGTPPAEERFDLEP